tara:strand:- start:702 stop:1883 length:1182 start_codon:yes stop_codon:yes gene_type:complete
MNKPRDSPLTLDGIADLLVDQLTSSKDDLTHLRQANKALFFDLHSIKPDHKAVSKATPQLGTIVVCKKRKRTQDAPCLSTLEGLHAANGDVFELIMRHLGLHAIQLRQTCKAFRHAMLAPGAAIAHVGLQVGPSIPFHLHVPRRTIRACAFASWNYFSYKANLQWHMEWAHYRKTLDLSPINDLVDAFECLPEGKDCFFGPVWLGKAYIVPSTSTLKCINNELDDYDSDDSDTETDLDDGGLTTCLHGSDYTSHVRLALYKAIEERMWDVCNGKDLGVPMDPCTVVPIVKRMLGVVGVSNDRCFHFTNKGWLKYTPFLLAAEAHNEELVRYLAKRSDTYLGACSTNGNNAYAICKQAMRRRGASKQEINKSRVLAFLETDCNLSMRSYIEEGR